MNKRLSSKDLADMKTMMINGVTPEDISHHFGVAISTVHAHKKKFKNDGVNIPDVRGQRPKGYAVQSDHEADSMPHHNAIRSTGDGKGFRIMFNGTRINISSDALIVNVTKEGVEVGY